MRIGDRQIRDFLSRYYVKLSLRRFELERRVFLHFFPSTKTVIDKRGKIVFISTVANGSDVRNVRIILPFSYPFSQPKCWIKPAPRRHIYNDGSMCVHFKKGGWNSERTAAQVLVAACDLCFGKDAR